MFNNVERWAVLIVGVSSPTSLSHHQGITQEKKKKKRTHTIKGIK